MPSNTTKIPFASHQVAAGFPSPAEDYVENRIDLNEELVRHPAATFFVRAQGNSMVDSGIHDGDILIVDRALQPVNGNVVIAVLNGEFTVKRLKRKQGQIELVPENPDYPPIPIGHNDEFTIWGVVTHTIHSLSRPPKIT